MICVFFFGTCGFSGSNDLLIESNVPLEREELVYLSQKTKTHS
jgi:hypothetical protein